jgi:hypothetical protein
VGAQPRLPNSRFGPPTDGLLDADCWEVLSPGERHQNDCFRAYAAEDTESVPPADRLA